MEKSKEVNQMASALLSFKMEITWKESSSMADVMAKEDT